MRKKMIWIVCLGILLPVLAAGIWAADYFLIPKVEKRSVKAPTELSDRGADAENAAALTTDSGYPVMVDQFPEEALSQEVEAGSGSESDPEGTTVLGASDDGVNRILVTKTVTGQGEDKVTYYVADLLLRDVRELKTCFAQDVYGENVYERTSDMADRSKAVFAVNGDCYGWRDDGIIIRNGSLFRDRPARVGLAIYEDGSMQAYEEEKTTGEDMAQGQVWHTFSFGPELVRDKKVLDGLGKEENYRVDLKEISHHSPRTAIGKVGENHFVFVVVDGRQPGYSKGMYLNELAELMKRMGCTEAYNLDGGASSTMYFKGQIVNHPCSVFGERGVSDCIFVN